MDVQKLLDEIASCHTLMGEKLHSLLFRPTTHNPFISIEYRPKCYDFAETIGFEAFNIRTDEVTARRILGILESSLAE